VKKILLEALVVGVIGLALSLAANGLSPHKISLSREYFPALRTPSTNAAAGTLPVTTTQGGESTLNPPRQGAEPADQASTNLASKVAARLAQKGLQLADSGHVQQLFQDPRYQQGLVVFVDARDDTHYQQGHIPGAWQLDYYRYETYLAALLPACMMAQEIIVYCNGGDCEDSEFTALLLRDAQIPLDKIRVYGGGFTEWRTRGGPIETGPRSSGQIASPKGPQPSAK
jgi:rhodanese-related sulfurtransferase